MKVLLALDGSDYSKRMLAHLAAHDELLGPSHEYTLFTAVAPIPAHAARYIDPDNLASYYEEQAQHILAPAETVARAHHWTVHTAHAAAHAAQAIADFAERGKFDLLVMGTRGHSSLTSMVLGSVTSGVLARCKIPTLLVH